MQLLCHRIALAFTCAISVMTTGIVVAWSSVQLILLLCRERCPRYVQGTEGLNGGGRAWCLLLGWGPGVTREQTGLVAKWVSIDMRHYHNAVCLFFLDCHKPMTAFCLCWNVILDSKLARWNLEDGCARYGALEGNVVLAILSGQTGLLFGLPWILI